MENSDADESTTYELSYRIYPIDEAPPENAGVFYRMYEKHDGKIQVIHRSDREVSDLFLQDVKIRRKVKKFISDTPVKEK
jgi:hypothetical protein